MVSHDAIITYREREMNKEYTHSLPVLTNARTHTHLYVLTANLINELYISSSAASATTRSTRTVSHWQPIQSHTHTHTHSTTTQTMHCYPLTFHSLTLHSFNTIKCSPYMYFQLKTQTEMCPYRKHKDSNATIMTKP